MKMTPAAIAKRAEFLQFVAERYGEYSREMNHVIHTLDTDPVMLSSVNACCQALADRDSAQALNLVRVSCPARGEQRT